MLARRHARDDWVLNHPVDGGKDFDTLMKEHPVLFKALYEGKLADQIKAQDLRHMPAAPAPPVQNPAEAVRPKRDPFTPLRPPDLPASVDVFGLPGTGAPAPVAPVQVLGPQWHGKKTIIQKRPPAPPPAPVKPAPVQRESWETDGFSLPTPRAGQTITGGKPAPVFRLHPPSNAGKPSPKTGIGTSFNMQSHLDDYRIASIVARLSARNQRIVGVEGWRPASDFNHALILAGQRIGATTMDFLGGPPISLASAPTPPAPFTTSSPAPTTSQPSQSQQFSFANTWTGGET
jgi:hypothetical protein